MVHTAHAEAEEMRLKGYNQKDVLNAEVQKAYASALGNFGSRSPVSGVADAANLGVSMGVMGGVMNMTKDTLTPMVNSMQAPMVTNWTCSCGQINGPIDLFCRKCSNSREGVTWNCTCGTRGLTTNHCPSCGASKPNNGWNCACGQKGITSNFCPNCGGGKPGNGWDCTCGQKGITSNFCPNCGSKKPAASWACTCGERGLTMPYCHNCGKKRDS